MIYKTLDRKLNIEHHEPHHKQLQIQRVALNTKTQTNKKTNNYLQPFQLCVLYIMIRKFSFWEEEKILFKACTHTLIFFLKNI